jgi:hypothetical protein
VSPFFSFYSSDRDPVYSVLRVYVTLMSDAMGCFRQKCGDFALGQKCYEQALKIYKATLGYDHPCVARVLHNIG